MKDDKPLLTEDGRRLTIDDGLITGTENPAHGLAFETGNVLDEKKEQASCPTDTPKQNPEPDKQ